MVVASEFMKSVLLYNGFPENMVNVIPYFTYLPELGNSAASVDEPLILCLGRLVREKGMHHVIRALRFVSEKSRLLIVGDGPASNELKSLSEELRISSRVSFRGWLSHNELDRLYRQCSFVVVPSVWPEPFGIVGIEAMAYEKPVVAFDVGGMSEWLKQKNGFLVPSGDEKGLAQKMNLLLEDKKSAEEMGRWGRKLVEERFTPSIHLEHLLSVFERAISEFAKTR
jgi:glycosyltransferase involved in cell wall biosynthesis